MSTPGRKNKRKETIENPNKKKSRTRDTDQINRETSDVTEGNNNNLFLFLKIFSNIYLQEHKKEHKKESKKKRNMKEYWGEALEI